MAGIDLADGRAGRIRSAYQDYLGRDAGDDEVGGWLSGSYGGGDVDDWVRQISESDEASRRRPAPPPNPYDPPPPNPYEPPPDRFDYTPPAATWQGSGSAAPTWDNDAWTRAAADITSAYDRFLGRGPAGDDVDAWLSGRYGHGSGPGDIGRMLEAIRTSDEATRRRGPQSATGQGDPRDPRTPRDPSDQSPDTSPVPPGQEPRTPAPWTHEAYAAASQRIARAYRDYVGRDASADEIRNWLTGAYGYGSGPADVERLVAAIAHISGNRRGPDSDEPPTTPPPGTRPPTTTPPPGTVPPGGWSTWFLGELTRGRAPSPRVLAAMAADLARYGIRIGALNARGFSDTIVLPDGSEWDVIEGATADGGVRWQWIPAGHGTGTSGAPPGPAAPNVSTRGLPGISTPGQQFSDPYTRRLEELLSARINELLQPIHDMARQQQADALQKRANALGTAETEYTQLMKFLQERFEGLQGPGYTGAEHEVLRTQALDPIERDRAAAKQRVIAQMSARGITLESGIAQEALNKVDAQFDAMRGQNQTALATNELTRREDRAQRAGDIGAQLVDIPQARQREQLDVFDALTRLSTSVRDEEEQRRREAITYGGAAADLPVQRLQLAMAAAGLGGNPASMVSSLAQVASVGNQAQSLRAQQSQNTWAGLGSLAAILAASGRR